MSGAEKLFHEAIAALNARNPVEAERLFKKFLKIHPSHVGALNLLTIVLMGGERFKEAEEFISRALKLNQTSDVSFYNHGIILKRLGKSPQALDAFGRAIQLNPNVVENWNNRGTVLNDLKEYEKAISDFDRAIALNRNYADAFCNKGKSLTQLKRDDEALATFGTALAINPNFAEAWMGRANVLVALKRYDEAISDYGRALAAKPDAAEAWYGRGYVLAQNKRYDEALSDYGRALTLKPDFAEAWLGRGNAFANSDRYDEAYSDYEKALALKPDLTDAWIGRGNSLLNFKRHDEALKAYDKALQFNPAPAEAWVGRGTVLVELRNFEEASAAYGKAIALKPDLPSVHGARLRAKMYMCDWSDFGAESEGVIAAIEQGKAEADPFTFLAVSASAEKQLQCARAWSALKYPRSAKVWQGQRYQHDRIRVAYLSGDFRDHPISYLLAGIFELHDKSRFETIGVSFGPDAPGDTQARIKASFERFIDAKDQSDADVVQLLRAQEIDILVDLMGHTVNARTRIVSDRPAPVQINYLGFPSTMGIDCIDYIVADRLVVPDALQQHYSEKMIYLPDTFQGNGQRKVEDQVWSRAKAGLPNHGFVFCSFNNNQKITPPVFDIWMRLLQRVDSSVLWLLSDHASVERNLRKEAEDRGVDPARLIFAPRVSYSDYLARYQLADLFLDTLPFNAGATASDALWAGLPLVTCPGESFSSRVAGSLLKATGMEELIANSLAGYEDLAFKLASDVELISATRAKLARHRASHPLFDAARFTRHLEAAYAAIHERHQAGQAPDHIDIPQSTSR